MLKIPMFVHSFDMQQMNEKKKTINENGRNEKQKLKELLEPPP